MIEPVAQHLARVVPQGSYASATVLRAAAVLTHVELARGYGFAGVGAGIGKLTNRNGTFSLLS